MCDRRVGGLAELGLAKPPTKPLIGKSESSLAGTATSGTHFGYTDATRATSVTGSSTVRRSLAALHGSTVPWRTPEHEQARPFLGLASRATTTCF